MTATAWPLNVPVLSDGVVTLRAHVRGDLQRMNEMANDPDMVRWTAVATPHPLSASEKFAFEIIPHGWDSGTFMCWAIEFEGRYAAMLSHEPKNYALLGYDGALHLRGVAFRSRRAEPYGEAFLRDWGACSWHCPGACRGVARRNPRSGALRHRCRAKRSAG